MEDRLIEYRRRRERKQEYKEVAAKSCYSMIIVMIALILLRPLMVSHMLSSADACSAIGLLEESTRQSEKALLIAGESSGAWHQLAKVYQAQGNREMAYVAYQKAAQGDCMDAQVHFELAGMYLDDGRHQLAIPYLERVRQLGPESPQDRLTGASYHRTALDMLVLCYGEVGDLAKMEMTLKEIGIFYPGYDHAGNRPADRQPADVGR